MSASNSRRLRAVPDKPEGDEAKVRRREEKAAAKAKTLGEFTDARLTDRIAWDLMADRYCWVEGLGWREYADGRWRECKDDSAVVEAIRVYMRDWLVKEAKGGDANRIAAVTRYLASGKIAALAKLARGKTRRRIEEFDAHPDLLNVPNGVVDLRTEELLPHDPAYLMTKQTAIDYDANAEDADWSKVQEALPPESMDYLMARFGQALTGYPPPDDKLLVQRGAGENGKTSVNGVVAAALGEYAALVPRELLLAKPGAHPTELMTLQGVRLAYIEELPEARTLNVQRLKETIGTPQITARSMRQDFITFKSTHTLMVNTNYRPEVRETDHGTWRRLEEVPWPYTYRKPGEDLRGEFDRRGEVGLRERAIASEASQRAALSEMVAWAAAWYADERQMPTTPAAVVDATREWRVGSDLLFTYIDEGHVVADGDCHIACVDLEAHLNGWLKSRRHTPWTDKLVSSRLIGHDALPFKFTKAKLSVRKDGSTVAGVASRPHDRDRFTVIGEYVEKLPNWYWGWTGVRFREPEEDA